MAYNKGAGQKARRREVMRAAERFAVLKEAKAKYVAECKALGKQPGSTAKVTKAVKSAEQVLSRLRMGLAALPIAKAA